MISLQKHWEQHVQLGGCPATHAPHITKFLLSSCIDNSTFATAVLQDELLHEPLACYPAPFPRDSLLLADAGKLQPRGQSRYPASNCCSLHAGNLST
jgi:hypothetical protein